MSAEGRATVKPYALDEPHTAVQFEACAWLLSVVLTPVREVAGVGDVRVHRRTVGLRDRRTWGAQTRTLH